MHLRLPTDSKLSKYILLNLVLLTYLVFQFSSFLITKSSNYLVHAQQGGVAPGENLQTNPKPRDTTVTALVVDNGPPSTPILIRPENQALLSTSRPTFVWKQSTDVGGIEKYVFYLDGEVYFDDLPSYPVDTALYTLTFDSDTGYYSLRVKNALTEGTHTWKIKAYDNQDNSSSSVTWTFTIDTQAPFLIIDTVETSAVSISSLDVSTVPTEPIVISSTNPLLSGTGESNASVQATVSFSNDLPDQGYLFTIDANGNWNLQLNNIPIGVVFYINFIITDTVGNVSTLSNVPFILLSTGLPVVSPLPSFEPSSPVPDITPPFIDQLPEVIEPLVPPVQIFINNFLTRVTAIPVKIDLTNILVLLLILTVLTMKLIAILLPLGKLITFSAVANALKMIFFFPFLPPQKRGAIFDHETGSVITYAPINIYELNQTSNITQKIDTIFSNAHGFIEYLPNNGIYSFSIEQPGFMFPATFSRPQNIPTLELYKGEAVELNNSWYHYLFVPLDRLPQDQPNYRQYILRHTHLMKFTSSRVYFITCIVICFLFPSLLNVAATIIYAFLLLLTLFHRGKLKGTIYDQDKNPVENVLVKQKIPQTNQMLDFDISDRNGAFCLDEYSDFELSTYRYHWLQMTSTLPVIIMEPSADK